MARGTGPCRCERRMGGGPIIKLVVAGVVRAHGRGRGLAQLPRAIGAQVEPSWPGDSWLRTGVTGQTSSNLIRRGLWIGAMAGFVAAAAVVMGWVPASWGAPLAG